MPVFAPDRWAPLLPWTVWVYFSLWVYICLPSTLIESKGLLKQYFRGAFWMAAIGIAIFIVFPTSTPQWTADWAGYPGTLTFMKDAELSRNACPSLHVSFALFTALWLDWLLRRIRATAPWRWGNALWAAAIIVTTLTTKQHVFIDVVFGVLLGGAIFAVNMYWVWRDQRLA
ncbi:hypothetical protein GCM10007047_06700 [Cerasicoccus arenae]|uniref:Phosphatidic acid phosphatase type 2/haloperoxidase domain-containing protein n=2 Tax=Cerasicoccus arenae TaxID=424488 RepID=A0A8J3DFI1_9BACT|nr:phosphatase PAP2 family protein [Cerasicoccus arenae]GHB93815.1 hypothetical protein GCM10007047_06700 [Cerasicoccus arenae]